MWLCSVYWVSVEYLFADAFQAWSVSGKKILDSLTLISCPKLRHSLISTCHTGSTALSVTVNHRTAVHAVRFCENVKSFLFCFWQRFSLGHQRNASDSDVSSSPEMPHNVSHFLPQWTHRGLSVKAGGSRDLKGNFSDFFCCQICGVKFRWLLTSSVTDMNLSHIYIFISVNGQLLLTVAFSLWHVDAFFMQRQHIHWNTKDHVSWLKSYSFAQLLQLAY